MVHFGDITKISGYDVPAVDIITGGSPCQDLSVAGKRAGLAGERSGLFMEQIRIIKEMRESGRNQGANIDVRPRYMVWENVPGAFSSNGGEDFRAVLEETAKVAKRDARIPRFEGRWPSSGAIVGDGWSIAWRVHDAQFWGVPQRRKRIALVADFGGLSAPEILFERKGMSGDLEQGRASRERTAGAAGGGVESASGAISFQERAGKPGGGKGILIQHEHIGALSTLNNQSVLQSAEPIPIHDQATRYMGKHGEKTDGKGNGLGVGNAGDPANTLSSADRHAVFDARGNGHGEIAPTMTGDHQNRVTDYTAHDQQVVMTASIVRRLTPLECERLQGYPDGWTDIGEWTDSKGKKHKGEADSPRYKALGNSIALPFWQWMSERMVAQFDRPVTMASLFDGIGGFPLAFSRCGCEPIWASEIEEFPIAVTKKRFGE